MRYALSIVFALFIAGGPAYTAGPSGVHEDLGMGPRVEVSEAAGLYTVTARFTVAETPAAVLAVLTDYEQIPRFMPGVRASVIRSRQSGRTVVEQEAVSKVMMVSKRVHLLLEVDEQADTLRFRDRCGKSFTRYEGSWQLVREGTITVVTYRLAADPAFEVPDFMLKRLLRRDSGDMIDALQREVSRRAAAAVTGLR